MTLKEFKESLKVGDMYQAYHQYKDSPAIKDLGVRELVLKNTVDFGFKTATGISYRQWPKKSELTITDKGFMIEDLFMKLTYTRATS